MATHTTCHVPTEEFALEHTLSSVPALSLTCERVVGSGDGTDPQLIRFRGSDPASLEPVLADDPTVEAFDVLSRAPDVLCYVRWSRRVRLAIQLLTATEALILSGTATADRWTFCLLVPTRDALSQLDELCTDRNLSVNVQSVQTWDGDGFDPLGLTLEQYEALIIAAKHGYFKVPRENDLKDIADEIDITHQALSERLRRGHDALIRASLSPSPTADAEANEGQGSTPSVPRPGEGPLRVVTRD
jgi:predicted DNA binding protein